MNNKPTSSWRTMKPATPATHLNDDKGQHVEVDPDLQRPIDLNLPRVAERHKLGISSVTLKFQKNVHRRGENARRVRGTLMRHDSQHRQLWRFLAIRGAWDSMLALLFPTETEQSTNIPAMDVGELCHFVRCKMNPKDMPLRAGNEEESNHLTDVHGKPMFCAGGWKAGKTMDMFGTSLSSIHKVHLHDESCAPSCPACQANQETIESGCAFHKTTRGPMALREGNPADTDCFLKNKQTLEDPNYQAKVSTQIDPSDVRNIRRATLGIVPTLAGLKFYVMCLASIKLFLRADEVIKIGCRQVPPELFLRAGGLVKAVGVSIAGETDKEKLRWFLLCADYDHPELCGLRHFLTWIYFSNIMEDESCVFPPDEDIHDEAEGRNGIYLRHESCSQLSSGLKTLAKDGVFEHDTKNSDFRATIHIFRKGACCFRIMAAKGDVDWACLRYDARHEREKDVFTCVRDANTLKQTMDFAVCPDMKVSDERPVRFETKCAATKIIGKSSDANGLTLAELASECASSLGVGPNPSLRAVLEAAMKPVDNNMERKRQRFTESLTRQQTLLFSDLWNSVLAQQNAMLNQHCEAIAAQQTAQEAAAQQQQRLTAVPEPARKKRKTTTSTTQPIDLKFDETLDRDRVKNLPTIQAKIEACKRLEERLPEKDKDLTPGAKKWVTQSLRPALRCLKNHHNNDINQCTAAWSTGWKMRHPCSGKGDSCVAS